MLATDPPPPPPPAYVIVIQADDLGIDDLAHRGNPYAYTPNLDALAANSLQALDFTVNAVCAPSRATLMTGRHFLRTGVHHVNGSKEFLHLDERTMGDAFRAGGWATGMWGKWHTGDAPGYLPWERGFDEAFFARIYRHEHSEGRFNGEPVEHGGWSDGVLVDYAIDFLDRHKDRPALLYLPTMTPHTPLRAPEHWVEFHQQRGLTGELAVLYGMVSYLDEQIGRLVAKLADMDQLENSLIVFTSDNGPAINRGQLSDRERSLRKSSARRGWKGDLWENGVRAPLLIHWPAQLEPGLTSRPLDQVDLLPSLLDWCDLEWPTDYPLMDGQSWGRHPEVLLESEEAAPVTFNYVHPGWITNERPWTPAGLPGEYRPLDPEERSGMGLHNMPVSVREGRYKLLYNPFPPEANEAGQHLLIDLYEDPGETTDLSEALPEVTARLKRQLENWIAQVKADPHAFTYAWHQIAEEGPSRIPAHQPAALSGGLHNTVHSLQNWSSSGDSATYQLTVPGTQEGRWTLDWEQAPPTEWGFRLSLNGQPVGTDTVSALPAGEHQLELLLNTRPENGSGDATAVLRALVWRPAN